jgi:hypothetical protein
MPDFHDEEFMAMPPCGTFHYGGVVPGGQVGRATAQWLLDDRSGAELARQVDSPGMRKRDNRLVGLHPSARISGSQLILQAPSSDYAQVHSASIELDHGLLANLRAGDQIELVRTATGDVGVCILRADELLWAVGAVTTLDLGSVRVRCGFVEEPSPDARPRLDTWVQALIDGQTTRLRAGDELILGQYRVTLARAFRRGLPGRCENAAISRAGDSLREAAIRAAASLRRGDAGLTMTGW